MLVKHYRVAWADLPDVVRRNFDAQLLHFIRDFPVNDLPCIVGRLKRFCAPPCELQLIHDRGAAAFLREAG